MTEYVTLKFGDSEITMSVEEAERLTEEDKAAMAAAMDGTDASIQASLRAQAETQDRAIAAVGEAGEVVAEAWCDRCEDGANPVAVLRRFSGGYVFDGHAPVYMAPEVELAHLERLRAGGSGRVDFVAEGRVVVILTEPRGEGTDWPPRAVCENHGATGALDPNTLLKAARAGTEAGRPQKMVVHPIG